MKLFRHLKQNAVQKQVYKVLKVHGLPEYTRKQTDYDEATQLIAPLYPVGSAEYDEARSTAADYVGIDAQEANDETEYQF